MNLTRRIAKNVGALIIGEAITRILSLILIIYIARNLGSIEFGKYSFAFAFTALFVIIADIGLSPLVIREVAREKDQAGTYLGNALIIKALLSIVAFLLIVIIINLLNYPPDTTLAVYIVGIYTISTSLSQIFRSIFRAFEKMEYEATLNILERLIFVTLGLTVLFLGYGLIELVSVFLVAGVLNFIISLQVTTKRFTKPAFDLDLKLWKHLIKEGLPFGLATIFIIIYMKIGIVLLSIIKGDAAAGWYNAAFQIPLAVSLISFAYMESIFPLLSSFHKASQESLVFAYKKSYKYLLIISLPTAAGITILAEKIILILYGEGFNPSVTALRILIWLTIFEFLGYLSYTVLASTDRQRINSVNTAICAVSNILLNLILIPPLGYVGASIATLVTYIMYFSLNLYSVSKYLPLISLKEIIRPITATISMGILLYLSRDTNILLLIPSATIFYIAFLYLTGAITKEELELWKDLGQRTDKQ